MRPRAWGDSIHLALHDELVVDTEAPGVAEIMDPAGVLLKIADRRAGSRCSRPTPTTWERPGPTCSTMLAGIRA